MSRWRGEKGRRGLLLCASVGGSVGGEEEVDSGGEEGGGEVIKS